MRLALGGGPLYIADMTLRACLFHPVVAASVTAILALGSIAPVLAQDSQPGDRLAPWQAPEAPPGAAPGLPPDSPTSPAPGPTPNRPAIPDGIIPEDPIPAVPARPPAEDRAADPTSAPASAADLDALFAELKQPRADPEDESWRRAESDILRIWSRSGSAGIDLLRQRGVAALDAGDTLAAIGHLTALTDHAPDYATGFVDRAAAYALNGDYGPAAADLQRALTLEPRNFLALTQLGMMLADIGDEARALAAFEASLAIHPYQPDAKDAAEILRRSLQGEAL